MTLETGTVLVELVCDRQYKDDCRAGTGIVWRGKGNQQRYPAHLWHKLAEHPDVWKVVPEADVNAPPTESPAERAKREGNEEAERVRAEAERKAAEAAGTDTDHVTLTIDPKDESTFDYGTLTQEFQDAQTYEQLQALGTQLDYGLHPRFTEANLRKRFAEVTVDRLAQAAEEGDTAGVDDTSGPV